MLKKVTVANMLIEDDFYVNKYTTARHIRSIATKATRIKLTKRQKAVIYNNAITIAEQVQNYYKNNNMY